MNAVTITSNVRGVFLIFVLHFLRVCPGYIKSRISSTDTMTVAGVPKDVHCDGADTVEDGAVDDDDYGDAMSRLFG